MIELRFLKTKRKNDFKFFFENLKEKDRVHFEG